MLGQSNLIARAEKEVFLATNYWMSSDASLLITDALRELSRRAEKRGNKAVVKIMYDRGNARQVCKRHMKRAGGVYADSDKALNNHLVVGPEQYASKSIQIPSPNEIPYIDLEVTNFHRPMLGTFHAKYMIVDRKIAVVSSNNIQVSTAGGNTRAILITNQW